MWEAVKDYAAIAWQFVIGVPVRFYNFVHDFPGAAAVAWPVTLVLVWWLL
jgi:hypothetical protein